MLGEDTLYMPVRELGKRIRSKQISPIELTESYIARSERLGPKLNAYVTITRELALQQARAAETNVYGYLLAQVQPSGEIQFTFRRLRESDVPAAVVDRYKPEFAHWCFAENSAAH